jgi:hypothetical protein
MHCADSPTPSFENPSSARRFRIVETPIMAFVYMPQSAQGDRESRRACRLVTRAPFNPEAMGISSARSADIPDPMLGAGACALAEASTGLLAPRMSPPPVGLLALPAAPAQRAERSGLPSESARTANHRPAPAAPKWHSQLSVYSGAATKLGVCEVHPKP